MVSISALRKKAAGRKFCSIISAFDPKQARQWTSGCEGPENSQTNIMDSDRINRWLTLGANIGVLIGIILLIVELRQNQEITRAQMSQARADSRLESYNIRAFSDHWPSIQAKREEADSMEQWIASLSPEEYIRLRLFYLGTLNEMANTAFQCAKGFLDDEVCTSMRAQLIRNLPIYPYVAANLEASRGPLFELLQELGLADQSLPLLNDDGSWSMPVIDAEAPFGRRPGQFQPRISGNRSAN